MTEKLYKNNVYETRARGTVSEVIENGKNKTVIMDKTIFFPEAGGQGCDIGTLGGFKIVDVQEDGERILHITEDNSFDLKPGDTADMEIDWHNRFDNMQRHCGEHILSGALHRMYGGVNRGFHMGSDYMTIDISLEDDPAYTVLTPEMLREAELEANRVIWSDVPVTYSHFDTFDEADKMPLRKKLAIESDITIVTIGDMNKPDDCCACCGTHPSSAGQVGLLKIYKAEPNKGMFRIYFEAGERAFRQYQQRLEVLTTLENKLSAGYSDILSKYDAQVEKNKEVRNRLYRLEKQMVAEETEDIILNMERCMFRKYDNLSIDNLLDIGRGLEGKINEMVFLVHNPTHTVLLFSDNNDCGKIVKENASIYGGKGGGRKGSARAIFDKDEYVDTFIDLVEKHLR